MYQLSLRFAQKWGVEQGRAYKALDVFRREVFQLSEDLRDDKPLLTWVHLCEAMVMEGLRELLDGVYPAVPEGEVTPEMAKKGIGSVGAVPLPEWLWQIYVSPRQEFLLSSAEEVRKVRGATASAIARTGALQQLSKQEADALGIPWSPTAAAFTIPKNETKARLILHGVRANQRQWEGGYKVLRVSLPQVESLAEAFSQGLRGWGANIDVTNCYWSILLPEGKSHLFRVGGEECMWVFKTLPFGWSYSPLMCQRLLAHLTGKVGLEVAGAVLRLMHYVDDFLVFGDSEAAVATKLAAFKEVLANAGFLISDKSSGRPERELAFLGKHVDFGRGVILNTRHTLEDALSRYVLMASRPVTRKSVQRVVGKLIWACRPSHWSNLFLAGPIAHVQWGAKWMPRPPTNLLRSLSGALWFAGRGWWPPTSPPPPPPPPKGLCPQVYSDAARDGNSGRLGMCSSAGAHHSLRVPLQNQQVLEFRGAAAAVKSVVGRKLPWATLHLDNQGVLWGLRTGKVGIGLREQRRCVRQIMYALAKGGDFGTPFVCTRGNHAGGLPVSGAQQFFWRQGHGTGVCLRSNGRFVTCLHSDRMLGRLVVLIASRETARLLWACGGCA